MLQGSKGFLWPTLADVYIGRARNCRPLGQVLLGLYGHQAACLDVAALGTNDVGVALIQNTEQPSNASICESD